MWEWSDRVANSAIVRYRQRSPADILGFESQYVDPFGTQVDWGEGSQSRVDRERLRELINARSGG